MFFKQKIFRDWAAILLLGGALSLSAAENKFEMQEDDTITTLLNRQKGQVVQLFLKSGAKLAGKVETVGTHLVHVLQLVAEGESYESAVKIDEISAIAVPARRK
ncbi:MAG: hypothetical protein M3463_14615 [Verrucomicrobiota bacterium]|nr:hypothetical protein [Verrucomicrobiota bacterium]